MSRIVIIGAGVMGCATALELAARGAREILLLERAVPGAEASSAAAGMLAAQAESQSDEERRYFVAAREAYATWADELHEWSGGVDIGYRKSGLMEIASTPAERDKLASIVRHDRDLGLNAEWLDGKAAREVEPELSPSVEAAAYFPDEAQVDPPQLLRALLVAISRHPTITIRGGSTVSSILEQSGRCTGVILDGHDVIHADAVVLAAGSWSSLVPGVPRSIPKVEPVRGQLVMLDERPPKLRTILFMDKSYVVPRGDGRVVCGSTMENVGHRREVTALGVKTILDSALHIAPSLASAELSRVWCNFRPHVATGPIVGASPLPQLFLATGHFRNGILLARAAAREVTNAVLASARA